VKILYLTNIWLKNISITQHSANKTKQDIPNESECPAYKDNLFKLLSGIFYLFQVTKIVHLKIKV